MKKIILVISLLVISLLIVGCGKPLVGKGMDPGFECTETDGGNDPDNKGTTSGWDAHNDIAGEKTDECISESYVHEWRCGDDQNLMDSQEECSEGTTCDDGACIAVDDDDPLVGEGAGDDVDCTDSDDDYNNGINLKIKGTTTGLSESGEYVTFTDYCDGDTLYEHHCKNNVVKKMGFLACSPQGTVCDDGACVKEVKEEICDDGIDNDDDGEIDCDQESCVGKKDAHDNTCCEGTGNADTCDDGFTCKNNICIEADEELVYTCTDTDGQNENEKGSVKITNNLNDEVSEGIDKCDSEEIVQEYICDPDTLLPGSLTYTMIKCAEGEVCDDDEGACVELLDDAEVTCDDPDKADPLVEKTTVTLSSGETRTDTCDSLAEVEEYYCRNTVNGLVIASKLEDCPAGTRCIEGACVKQIVPEDEVTCEDPDLADPLVEKTTVTLSSGDTGTDNCFEGSKVEEFYCLVEGEDSPVVDSTINDCPTDTECKDGACVAVSEEEEEEEIDFDDKCKDTDKGYKIYSKGKLYPFNDPDSLKKYDACLNKTMLYEYYCGDVIEEGEVFDLGDTEFQYIEAESSSVNDAEITIDNIASDETIEKEYNTKGQLAKFTIKHADVRYFFYNKESHDQNDFEIMLIGESVDCAELGGTCKNGICVGTVADKTTTTKTTTTTTKTTTTTTDTAEEEEEVICDGCIDEELCYPFGTRKTVEEVANFCTADGWEEQRAGNESCIIAYECQSDECVEELCTAFVEPEVKEPKGFFSLLVAFFKKLFGFN
jgi:hypothetical protein